MSLLINFALSLLYLIAGAVFAYFRWTQHVDSECAFYETERTRFLGHYEINGDEMPDHLKYEWRNIVKRNKRLSAIPPQYTQHRGQILFDITLWWVSLLTLLVFKFYATSVLAVRNLFGRVTDAKSQRINRDLKG